MVPSLKICIHIGIRMNIKAPLCKKTDKNLEYIKKGYYICDVLTDTISIRFRLLPRDRIPIRISKGIHITFVFILHFTVYYHIIRVIQSRVIE